ACWFPATIWYHSITWTSSGSPGANISATRTTCHFTVPICRPGGTRGRKGSSDVQHIRIDIISDVVCPWCYLGQTRLHLALERVGDVIDAEVAWRPYQLERNAPPEGLDTFDYRAKKIGGAERVKQSHARLTRLGAEIGLPFALDKASVFPNTLDAHRLIRWAGVAGPGLQDRVAHALFAANFAEGRNVGDRVVLADIAAANGLDRTDIEKRLATDE